MGAIRIGVADDTGCSKSLSATHFQEFGLYKQQCYWSESYKASTASDAASSFWCGFFPFPGWENLGHSLYFSYSRQLSRFALSRASFYLELKLKEGTSSLCAYRHWWLLASLTTQLIGSGLKIWFGADFCFRPSRKKHGTARLICPLQFNHGRRSVCWSSILFCNRNSRCLVCLFFFLSWMETDRQSWWRMAFGKCCSVFSTCLQFSPSLVHLPLRLCLDATSLRKVKLKSIVAFFICMW